MGRPLQPEQHRPLPSNSLPPTNPEQTGGALPQAAEERLVGQGCCSGLMRPSSMGDVRYSCLFPWRQWFFPCRVHVCLSTGPTQPVRWHCWVTVSILPGADCHGRPLPTADAPIFLTSHDNLPELLLLTCFVLVYIDCAQLPVTPLYGRPFSVLEWSTHFFLLKLGDRTNKVSMLHLKLAWTLADTEQVLCRCSASRFSVMAQLQQSCLDVASMLHWQPAHHLPSGGWSYLDWRQFQQGSAILWYPHRCARLFSSPYTPSTTQRCRWRGASSQPDFAGHKCPSGSL